MSQTTIEDYWRDVDRAGIEDYDIGIIRNDLEKLGFTISRVEEQPTEEPKQDDLKQTIIDGQRLRLSQLHDACEWLVDKLTPFENMEAIGPLEGMRLREIAAMLKGVGEEPKPETQNWISVKYMVPEKSGYYWVFMPNYSNPEQHSAFWNDKEKAWLEGSKALGYDTEFVTHWMHLPKPPKS